MLLGDMIHNFRAALDHQMWAIAPKTAKAGRNARRVQFPIHTTTKGWTNWRKEWGQHYGEKVLAVLAEAQPCHLDAERYRYHPLGLLQSLSNTDKHRALNVTAHMAHDGYPFRVTPEPPGGVRVTTHAGPIEPGTVIARAEWDRAADGNGEIDVAPTIAYDQQVFVPDLDTDDEQAGEWHPLGELTTRSVLRPSCSRVRCIAPILWTAGCRRTIRPPGAVDTGRRGSNETPASRRLSPRARSLHVPLAGWPRIGATRPCSGRSVRIPREKRLTHRGRLGLRIRLPCALRGYLSTASKNPPSSRGTMLASSSSIVRSKRVARSPTMRPTFARSSPSATDSGSAPMR